MTSYYCTACWRRVPGLMRQCPVCGAVKKICNEEQYADIMIRYLHHPMSQYRRFALRNIKRIMWKAAIPEIQERIRIERDPDIRSEAQRIVAFIESCHSGALPPVPPAPLSDKVHQYMNLYEMKCGVIPIRQVLKKYSHDRLRAGKTKK